MLIISTELLQQLFRNIFLESLTKSSDMLNKNTLGVEKVRGQSEATMVIYKRPKTLISSKAKKLKILLRIFSLE